MFGNMVRATYSKALITSTEIMTEKLKEKMMKLMKNFFKDLF